VYKKILQLLLAIEIVLIRGKLLAKLVFSVGMCIICNLNAFKVIIPARQVIHRIILKLN